MKRACLAMMVVAVFSVACATVARAAGLPAEVDVTALRAIQLYSLDEKSADHAYWLVEGIAAGKDVQQRFPADSTIEVSPKKPAFIKTPQTLWKGDLDEGQFALLTMTLMIGDGKDEAKLKQFTDQIAAAQKKTAQFSKPTLSAADAKNLADGAIKNQQPVIVKIKDLFSRAANTDHFGGQFNLLVWNNGGKIAKRLDPIGLTFGEHFGTDLKIYTKLKATRSNVLVQDENGQLTEEQLLPLDDEETAIRVKMLETESVTTDKGPTKHVTDYLAEIKVKDATGKPLHWTLQGENTGYDVVHTYYDFAE